MNNAAENKLEHSNSAISICHTFYNKKVMVYVEGDDDISFWDEIFKRLAPEDFYEIEQVHGKNNLQLYLKGVENGDIKNTFVACDSDYNAYVGGKRYTSPYIILTYGHSIENSMFCPTRITSYIRKLTHDVKTNHFEKVSLWLDDFCNESRCLIPYDIAAIKYGTELKCMGYGSDRFMKGKTPNLDSEKIENFIEALKPEFIETQIENVKLLMEKDERETRYVMQGHYYASGVMRFIRWYIGKIQLSNSAIYAEFATCNKECGSICFDRKMLEDKIRTGIEAYNES